jgi:hypothetical protein
MQERNSIPSFQHDILRFQKSDLPNESLRNSVLSKAAGRSIGNRTGSNKQIDRLLAFRSDFSAGIEHLHVFANLLTIQAQASNPIRAGSANANQRSTGIESIDGHPKKLTEQCKAKTGAHRATRSES